MKTPTIQDFFEYKILAAKMNDQVKMILENLVVIDKDALGAAEDHWEVLEQQLPLSKPWPKEMYILGDKFYSVCVYGEGIMGPIKVEFPIAYLFMDEKRVKKDIEYIKKSK